MPVNHQAGADKFVGWRKEAAGVERKAFNSVVTQAKYVRSGSVPLMNWYIIGGILCAALSTFLLTYGGIFRSRTESKQSEKQLEQISNDLAKLKGKPKSDLSKDALARVEKDVQKWAAEFASDKQKKKLILEQKRSEHETSLEHSNALAREYFRFFIAVLRDAMASYSAASGHPITTELPEVSDAVFSNPDHPYEGTITFNATSSWKIRTMCDARSGPDVAPPWVIMSLLKNSQTADSPQEKGELLVRFTADMKSFFMRLQQDFLLAVPNAPAAKPTTDYEETIRATLIELIEFQLLQD